MQEAQRPLSICLLGVPEIRINGRPLLIRRRLVRAVLYYLAFHQDGVSRDELAALVAPDAPQRTARRRLSQIIWHLRQALGAQGTSLVRADIERVWLAPSCWVDVRGFLKAMRQIDILSREAQTEAVQELEQAVELYRGEFLKGFALSHHQEFEEWVLLQRERLSLLYLNALIALAQVHTTQGNFERALGYAQQALAVDPLRENVHRLLMQLYALMGQREKALAQYEECVLLLERELGLDPLPETVELYRAILEERVSVPTPTGLAPGHLVRSSPSLSLPDTDARSPFVGRQRHLQYLHRVWQQAKKQGGHIVFLRGEAGVGKTRLIREFAIRERCPLLVARGNPSHIAGPYYPLAVALRMLLPHIRWSDLRVPQAVLSEVSRILPELRTYCPYALHPPLLEPRAEPAMLSEALFHFLRAALNRPYVFFMDDAHWLSDTLWEWFSFLLPHLGELPILFVFAYRADEAGPVLLSFVRRARSTGRATLLDLKGLTRQEVIGLVTSMRRRTGYPAAPLGHYLYRLTGGNCLFVLETLRWLEEHGGQSTTIPVPERVQEVIQHRVEMLPAFVRRILEAAAVLAPHITVELLARTVGSTETRVLQALEVLTERDMLAVEEGRPTYVFSHEQLRLVVYGMMNSARRQHLHREAAKALQELQPSYVGELDIVLAYHWEIAGELARAVNGLVAAMAMGDRQFAYRYVVELAGKALALISASPEEKSLEHAKLLARFWRGRAYRALRQYRRAQEDLKTALALSEVLGVPDVEARVFEELIHIAVDCWHMDRALALAKEYLQLAQRQDDSSLMARALYLHAFVAIHARHDVDDAELQRALEIFEQERNLVAMAEVLNLRGVRDMFRAQYPAALDALDEALRQARQVHHLFLMHRIQANRGHVYYNMADFPQAMAAFTRAEEWLQAVGVTRPDLLYELGRGYTALHLGRSHEAEQCLSRAAKLAKTMLSSQGLAAAYLQLSHLRLLQGREEEARALLKKALSMEGEIYEGTAGLILAFHGALMRQQGNIAEAVSVHRHALRHTRSPLSFRAHGILLCEFGWDMLALERSFAAKQIFHHALQLAHQRRDKVIEIKALAGLAAVHPGERRWWESALERAKETGSLLLLTEVALTGLRIFAGTGREHRFLPLLKELHPRLVEAGWHAPLEVIEAACGHFVESPLLH